MPPLNIAAYPQAPRATEAVWELAVGKEGLNEERGQALLPNCKFPKLL